MARAPFQVLILPYRPSSDGGWQFAVFRRADGDATVWQFLAGGGEDDETPEASARREMAEEAGISRKASLTTLEARADIPTDGFRGRYPWAERLEVIPEHAFAAPLPAGAELQLSNEHAEMRWLEFETARVLLTYESNRTALTELRERLEGAAAT